MSVALATKARSGMRGGQGVGRVDVGRLVRLDVIRTMARIPSKNSLISPIVLNNDNLRVSTKWWPEVTPQPF